MLEIHSTFGYTLLGVCVLKFYKMEKVKIFYGCNDATGLEKRINEWLDVNKVNIVRVLQDASGRLDHKVTITIFYTVS